LWGTETGGKLGHHGPPAPQQQAGSFGKFHNVDVQRAAIPDKKSQVFRVGLVVLALIVNAEDGSIFFV
jgi:hypothetical protein